MKIIKNAKRPKTSWHSQKCDIDGSECKPPVWYKPPFTAPCHLFFLFRLSSTKTLTVKMYDYIDFICPTRNPTTSRYISRLERRHNSLRTPVRNFTVHQMLGESGFALCDTNRSQIILECKATSAKENKFSVRVQRKSAQPSGLVFVPNTTYYYLWVKMHKNQWNLGKMRKNGGK